MMIQRLRQGGYTLVEVVIVLSIIGLVMVVLVSGSAGPIKNDRFAGQVREFANRLRESQTKSYTVAMGSCPVPSSCYWRGNVLNYTAGASTYTTQFLRGADISLSQGNQNPTTGITGTTNNQTFTLEVGNLQIEDIFFSPATNLPSVSLAFLSPAGKAYWCSPVPSCTPGPFTNDHPLRFTLTTPGLNLTGIVTFDPVSGTIDSKVQ